jgi:hypothetical protein
VDEKRLRANLAAFSFSTTETGNWKLETGNWQLKLETCKSHKPHILRDFGRKSET